MYVPAELDVIYGFVMMKGSVAYDDDPAEMVAESVAEASHVIRVDLDGSSAPQHRQHVAAQGDVLRIPPP